MANIKNIAKLAGVSVTTVSRVINGIPYVSDEKKEAVLRAMEITNYERNINAVHLIKGKTSLIGVVVPCVPSIKRPYFGLVVEGIAEEALKNNYNLVLIQTNYEEQRELEALKMLKLKQLDALRKKTIPVPSGTGMRSSIERPVGSSCNGRFVLLLEALVHLLQHFFGGHALRIDDGRLGRRFGHSHHILVLSGNDAAIAALKAPAFHGNDVVAALLQRILDALQTVLNGDSSHVDPLLSMDLNYQGNNVIVVAKTANYTESIHH